MSDTAKEIHDMIQQTQSTDSTDRILDILLKMNERMNEIEAAGRDTTEILNIISMLTVKKENVVDRKLQRVIKNLCRRTNSVAMLETIEMIVGLANDPQAEKEIAEFGKNLFKRYIE